MMATEIIEIDASWAEKWTKTRVSFLSAPSVFLRLYFIAAIPPYDRQALLGPGAGGDGVGGEEQHQPQQLLAHPHHAAHAGQQRHGVHGPLGPGHRHLGTDTVDI